MFRFILGALLSAILIAAPARADPTEDQVRAAAQWSSNLQGALLALTAGIERMNEYSVVMDAYAQGDTSLDEAQQASTAVTAEMHEGIDTYVEALEALPPHPMRREPIGKASGGIRIQLIAQADDLRAFVNRLDTLMREALSGDTSKVDQLAGEIFRGSALLMGTDIAILRTQVAALDEMSPLRSLNLAQIAEMQFLQEVMYFEAAYRYGAGPGVASGDLDAAGRYLATARAEIANGRRNVETMRAALKAEMSSLAAPSPIYDRLFPMLDTFAGDWAIFEDTLDQADHLLKMMRADAPETEEAFSAYLDASGAFSVSLLNSQVARANLLAN